LKLAPYLHQSAEKDCGAQHASSSAVARMTLLVTTSLEPALVPTVGEGPCKFLFIYLQACKKF